jgi:hypothetical protein
VPRQSALAACGDQSENSPLVIHNSPNYIRLKKLIDSVRASRTTISKNAAIDMDGIAGMTDSNHHTSPPFSGTLLRNGSRAISFDDIIVLQSSISGNVTVPFIVRVSKMCREIQSENG